MNIQLSKKSGYAAINGLNLYYEVHGQGVPLVYIHPAKSHGAGKDLTPLTQHHTLITVDLQGHGRTADIADRPISLEQNAKDIVGLLDYLGIAQADILGESYGGATAVLIAVHHPERVGRVATYGATFGPNKDALNFNMLKFDSPPTPDSSCFQFQRAAYEAVAPDPGYWPKFWKKSIGITWEGFSREELASIRAPVLIVLGDRDFVRLEHVVDTLRVIPHAELAVIPDAGHFALFSEPGRVLPVIEHFLRKPEQRAPVATAGVGYQPGQTR